MLIPPLFTAPAGLEIGQHLTSATVRCLHQPDPPFSSVTHVMCFGFRAPVYGRQLIWTAVAENGYFRRNHLVPLPKVGSWEASRHVPGAGTSAAVGGRRFPVGLDPLSDGG